MRGFIEELLDEGLDAALGRSRYRRSVSAEEAGGSGGYRYGRRNRVRLDRKCGLMRCTVHVHRNLLAPASERLHEEVPADYNDMVYTVTPKEIETRRRRVQGRRGALLFPAVVWRRGPREVHGE